MIWLFRQFRANEIERAIAIWAEGDRKIAELIAAGEALRARAGGRHSDPQSIFMKRSIAQYWLISACMLFPALAQSETIYNPSLAIFPAPSITTASTTTPDAAKRGVLVGTPIPRRASASRRGRQQRRAVGMGRP
jgi:hypothetical protein